MRFLWVFLLGVSTWLNGQKLDKYQEIIKKSCKEEGIPTFVLAGLLWAESEGNPNSISGKRADGSRDEGIAQLNSKYLDYFSWKFNKGKKINPFDPSVAIPVAARILKHNYAHFGNWYEAIAAYRQGIKGVEKDGITHHSVKYLLKIDEYRKQMDEER